MAGSPQQDGGWVYDWNSVGGPGTDILPAGVELDDETLRDGLQNPSVIDPPLEEKKRYLHILSALGVNSVDIGLPAAGGHYAEDTLALAREIAEYRLPLSPNCAARTLAADIDAIINISQKAGIAIEIATFVGSSPIRHIVEGWDLKFLLRATENSVKRVIKAGLPSMFVTEDTTRAHPDMLKVLYTTALNTGSRRVCIADTAGFASPRGSRSIVLFMRDLIARSGISGVGIDWHGHMDRGLGVANSIAAFEAGATRVHGSGLGLGERVGNTPLDQLVVNFKMMGFWPNELLALKDYVEWVAKNTGVEIPPNYPVFGRNAYRTGTGIHASAIYKAVSRGESRIAELVYSSVPASWFGLTQVVEVGPMSWESNVLYWLREHGVEAEDDLVHALVKRAKSSRKTLSDDEIRDEIDRYRGGSPE